jgi:nitroreductase
VTLLDLSPDELLSTTRSVRKRLDFDRPVEREVLDECLALAQQAPNASNSEPWRFVVVTEQATRTKLAECYATGWASYRKAIDEHSGGDDESPVLSSAQYLADRFHEVPVMVLPCLIPRADTGPVGSQAGQYGSVIQAAWSFQLAARARARHVLDDAAPRAGARRGRDPRHPVRPRAAGRPDHGRLLARHRLQARPPGRARARRALRALALTHSPARSRHTHGRTRNARRPHPRPMTSPPSISPCETVRVDRAALHAFIDAQADLIERTPVPDDVLTPEDLFPAALDPERLWRVAGIATLIGLSIYEDAERFVTAPDRP